MPPIRLTLPLALAAIFFAGPMYAAQDPASGEPADYVPTDATDAVRALKQDLDSALLAKIKKPKSDDDDLFFLGTGLRNSWGLWKDSRLAKWFVAQGVNAPEDMTAIIIDDLQADLQGKPFDLDEELKETHAGELKAVAEAEQEKQRALRAADRIAQMMLHIEIIGQPEQRVVLPPRTHYGDGVRVRSMAPFGGGFLLTGCAGDGNADDAFYSPAYFLDAQHSVHLLRVKGMSHVDAAVVIDGNAYVAGPAAQGELLVVSDGHATRPLPSPPGAGHYRLGMDGTHLLVLRNQTVYRLDGYKWTVLIETKTPIPWSLVPPVRVGNRIYLRDEGHYGDNKRLWWIDLDHAGAISCFDQDCGVVGSAGPRWENVLSYALEPDGTLWAAAGYSLIRWNSNTGYRVALMNGNTTFTGELIRGTNPASINTNWTQIDSHDDSEQAVMGITGIVAGPGPNTLTLCGPRGLFKLSGTKLTPLLTFSQTAQLVPMDVLNPETKQPERMHWSLDPTHLLPLDHDTWLIGGHWEGVYLLARDPAGRFHFTALDERLGPEMTLDHLGSP